MNFSCQDDDNSCYLNQNQFYHLNAEPIYLRHEPHHALWSTETDHCFSCSALFTISSDYCRKIFNPDFLDSSQNVGSLVNFYIPYKGKGCPSPFQNSTYRRNTKSHFNLIKKGPNHLTLAMPSNKLILWLPSVQEINLMTLVERQKLTIA